jgi:predicted AlkP superfamily phosphohydrolase/phosphomutase
MSAPDYRVLIIGLDGATFDLMLPWIQANHLPTLGRLVKEGAWSHLRSTVPPVTPCAWSSFMTGKNPGKHGLFDFLEPVAAGRSFRFTNASSRHAESLWGYLSRHGRRVGVINVPMTYPPEPVNGYLIAGMDTPDERCPYIYPEEVREELRSQAIDYHIDVRHVGNMRTEGRRDRILQEFFEIDTIRTQALKHLSRRYPADFRMVVFSGTDQVPHHFWHYMDATHDQYDACGAERYGNAVRDIYIHSDQLIASALEDVDEQTVVLIMSDHGFGPTTSLRLRINQALEHAGLLAFTKEGKARRGLRVVAGVVDRVLRSTLSAKVKQKVARILPRLRVWFEKADEAPVDWSQTTAYTNEVSRSIPAIWLNHARVGAGEEEVEHALDATEAALAKLTDPKTGRPAISHFYRARDLYDGPYVAGSPDLIPSWWEDGWSLEQSVPGGPPDQLAERTAAPLRGGLDWTGTHRMNGVFIMAGGPARRGHQLTGAQIIDVAPTVLYLMGLPIPDDMDGRPLLEAIDPDFVASHPPQHERAAAPAAPGQEVPFSAAEEEMIARRLKAMGYIE